MELLQKRKIVEERRSVTPRSILEFVDYESLLAKRKAEEEKFRNLNHAGSFQASPTVNDSIKINSSLYPNTLNHVAEIPVQRNNEMPMPDLSAVHLNSEEKLDGEKSSIIMKGIDDSFNHNVKQNITPRQAVQGYEIPFFRRTGGGGEPVKDLYGNLITARGFKNDSASTSGKILAFPSLDNPPNKIKMFSYREELQKQIEEKKRLEALKRQETRQLEDKIAERIEEQRLQMQREYEMELQKNNKMKEEFQRQQARIQMLEEFQRKDAEMRKKKFLESRASASEKVLSANKENSPKEERSHSPPVPAVRTKAVIDRVVSPASTIMTVKEAKPGNIISSLSEIRRSILQEQQKLQRESKHSYEVMNRRTIQEVSDDDDDDYIGYDNVHRPGTQDSYENYRSSGIP